MKQCSKCKKLKDIGEFHKSSQAKDGLRSWCKICHCAEVREYNAQHKKLSRYEKYHKIVDGNLLKLCTVCDKWKSANNYYKSNGIKSSKSGLCSSCKSCRGIRKAPLPEKKKCSVCSKTFSIDCFYKSKRDGVHSACKICNNQNSKISYRKNRTKALATFRVYYQNNKDKYRYWHTYKPERVKIWRQRDNERRRKSIKRTIDHRMSTAIRLALKRNKNGRHWPTLVDYTTEQLKERLESTMPKSKTWKDFLSGDLHIDHIIPKCMFTYKKPEDEQFRKCWALDNLQLLTAKENYRKHKKLIA